MRAAATPYEDHYPSADDEQYEDDDPNDAALPLPADHVLLPLRTSSLRRASNSRPRSSSLQRRRSRRCHSLAAFLLLTLVAVILVLLVPRVWRHDPASASDRLPFDLLHSVWSPSPHSINPHHPLQPGLVPETSGVDFQNQPGTGIQLHPYDHTYRGPRYSLYRWNITAGERRPDGVKKRVYLINGRFPGPTIEARQGDILMVEVTNALQDEGVSIHWHGLHQAGYQSMDGAVGFTQDPIKPGKTFVYRFQLPYDQRGTFWYHAHDELQRGDGLYGGFIIHANGGDGVNSHGFGEFVYEQLFLIGDWYHRSSRQVMDWYWSVDSFGNEPVPDSVLINGRGAYDCSKAVRARPVDCQQVAASNAPSIHVSRPGRYRFRLVNVGSLAGFSMSFGDNNATLVTVDGGNLVNRSLATGNYVGVLHPGERADVLVDWLANDASIHLTLDSSSFRYPNPALTTDLALPVTHTDRMDLLARPHPPPQLIDLSNLSAPLKQPKPPRGRPDHTLVLYINTEKLAHKGNLPTSSINHTSWRPQSPPLLSLTRDQYDPYQFVPYIHSPQRDPVWVDLVLNNLDDGPHPFHLHGYHFYVLARSVGSSYWGSWNAHAQAEPPGGPLQLDTPVRKDTVLVPRRGYAVLRFRADNWGVWALHCHVLWHMQGGMGMALEVGKEALPLPLPVDEPGVAGGDAVVGSRDR